MSIFNHSNIIGMFKNKSQVLPSPKITAANNMRHILPVFCYENISNAHKIIILVSIQTHNTLLK